MSAKIYIEGGGNSKELHARCREGFRKLIEKIAPSGKMPRLVACGGRDATFDDFKTAHSNAPNGTFVAMLVDSEDPVEDFEDPWAHLRERDHWARPPGASDEQALLMVTCMESWVAADRPILKKHYGSKLKEDALPPLHELEKRERAQVHEALCKATKACTNAYQKGERSFKVLGELTPSELRKRLKSFDRVEQVLKRKL